MKLLTPVDIEQRLNGLSEELDEAYEEMAFQEMEYQKAKHKYEMTAARARMQLGHQYKDSGLRLTVQDKEDMALEKCQGEALALAIAEAQVKASRANLARIRTQIDVARSMGASIRSATELV